MKKFIKIERPEGKIEKEDKRVESKTVALSGEKK